MPPQGMRVLSMISSGEATCQCQGPLYGPPLWPPMAPQRSPLYRRCKALQDRWTLLQQAWILPVIRRRYCRREGPSHSNLDLLGLLGLLGLSLAVLALPPCARICHLHTHPVLALRISLLPLARPRKTDSVCLFSPPA